MSAPSSRLRADCPGSWAGLNRPARPLAERGLVSSAVVMNLTRIGHFPTPQASVY
jgi:hypothetical protein